MGCVLVLGLQIVQLPTGHPNNSNTVQSPLVSDNALRLVAYSGVRVVHDYPLELEPQSYVSAYPLHIVYNNDHY